ncbi:MAG TPA: hypothetical protein VHT75_11190 [Acidimicrobiales bacterium]|jgi:hypothetical protein|nr:hypothetical protein [Acidimicrobiales bacterium]
MTTGEDTTLPVELWPAASPSPDVVVFTARSGDRELADVVRRVDSEALRVSVATRLSPVATAAELAALVGAIITEGQAQGRLAIMLADGTDLRLRYFARAAGFQGPLRGDLRLDLRASPAAPAGGESGVTRLVSDLEALLPDVTLATRRPPGIVRSILRSAASGVSGTVHLIARLANEDRALQLAVPVTSDVLAESVALAVDSALSLRRRFRPLLDPVRVFFDEEAHGMRVGTIAGLAAPSVRDVHLNSAYLSLSGQERLQRQRAERTANPDPARRPPLTVLPPFTWLDALVAHEFWHQIEFGLESARYRDSVEFRRVVGRYFGVETLEQAIKGARADAPSEWQAAHRKLAGEVSAYGATAPKEATAELFAQWWCTPADPPPPARFFGPVLRQFFPTADLARS